MTASTDEDLRECTCEFVSRGEPMRHDGCLVHPPGEYHCGQCSCRDYRPLAAPTPLRVMKIDKPGFTWARCACGHMAQEHDRRKT